MSSVDVENEPMQGDFFGDLCALLSEYGWIGRGDNETTKFLRAVEVLLVQHFDHESDAYEPGEASSSEDFTEEDTEEEDEQDK